MSRNAVVFGVSCTIVAGISPATILQNRQSASCWDGLSAVLMDERLSARQP
jgi:hypothetical protein